MEDPAAPDSLVVSTRWPPLAPKNESGCRRLSRKEVSPVSERRRERRNMPTPASKARPAPPAANSIGFNDSSKPGLAASGGCAGTGTAGADGTDLGAGAEATSITEVAA